MLAAHSIVLAGGRSAIAVDAPADVSGEEAVAALALPRQHGAIVLNGGTTELPTDLAVTLRDTLGNGLARVAVEDRLTVVTGGTDAGIFSLFGQALGDERTAPCIGVVPAGRVIWPERASPADRGPEDEELVPLEPHHSHFLLVAGDEWGAETEAMLSLVDALSADCGSLAVLAGGGAGDLGLALDLGRRERGLGDRLADVLEHLAHGRGEVVAGLAGALAQVVDPRL